MTKFGSIQPISIAKLSLVYILVIWITCNFEQVVNDRVQSISGINLDQPHMPFSSLCGKVAVKELIVISKSVKIVEVNFEARYIHGNIQKLKGIINLHLNIRSLRNKIVEVKRLIKEHNPHIFGISEAELDKNRVCEKSLKIPGYDVLFPRSWSKSGYARVVVYVKKSFNYQQIHELEDDRVQSIWLKGGYKNSKNIFFCHAYREHLSEETSAVQHDYLNTFLGQWDSAVHFANSAELNETHICGDLNIDVYQGRWLQSDYPLVSLSRLIKSGCHLNNFHQLVKDITRVKFNSIANTSETSCIDHIYTNARFRCSEPSIISFGDSDHDLLKYVRYSKIPPIPARIICKRNYKNFDKNAFLDDVSRVDWYDVYCCQDVNDAVETFTKKFKYVLNCHAPWIRVQQRKQFTPWLTEETKRLMCERDKWKRVASSTAVGPTQVDAWNKYKRYRNRVNNRKKNEEQLYKTEKLASVADCPNTLWKSAKTFMGWKGVSGPSRIRINNVLVSSASKLAQGFNNFFIDKIASIRSSMARAEFPIEKLKEIMYNKNCKMQLNHVSLAKVEKILKSLSSSKSTGIDELDNFSVKLASEFIAQPVHHIICLSVIQNEFPAKWKLSKVLPLYKKGDDCELKNYRPVSILSPLSKVLEKIVFEQMYSYFTRNNLFHKNLHGYRKSRSTQTALLQMYDRWARAAHEGKLSGVVLLDLSSAFDLVDPELLLKKLKIYGFDRYILAWVESYLKNRSQAVWIDNTLSEFRECPIGVPQGSNLGPLLFLIFYNDLPYTLNCHIDSYADDSTMTVSSNNAEEIGVQLSLNCDIVKDWMLGNRLKVNAEKTHLLTVGTSTRLRCQDSQVKVKMDGVEIKESDSQAEILLGVTIQSNLKWHNHINSLLNKLQVRLNALEKLRYILPFSHRKTIVEGIFISVLSYCLPVFCGSDQADLDSLQVMQNKAARIITNSGIRTNRNTIFNELGWMTVRQLAWYHTALSTYRIRKNREPEYLSHIMNYDNRRGKIIVPNSRLSLAKNSFCFRGADQWNKLPETIRQSQTVKKFKVLLKNWVFSHVPKFSND